MAVGDDDKARVFDDMVRRAAQAVNRVASGLQADGRNLEAPEAVSAWSYVGMVRRRRFAPSLLHLIRRLEVRAAEVARVVESYFPGTRNVLPGREAAVCGVLLSVEIYSPPRHRGWMSTR